MHEHNDNIICFKHCASTSIFCKKIPLECPICNINLEVFPLEPVIIPNPLTSAADNQCCIVIKPSEGCFLCDYSTNDNLHIAVTNSQRNVIEYDRCGLVKYDNEKWKNCVAIQLVPNSWYIFWDKILSRMCNDLKWHGANYDTVKFNCFTFVISFLQNINYNNAQFTSKEEICELLILPKIQTVLKYNVIHRQLLSKEFYFQE